MTDTACDPLNAIVPAGRNALVGVTERMLSVAETVKSIIDRERYKAFLRRHPDFRIWGLSHHYPLDADLIERFADRWDWRGPSSNEALPRSLELIERFEDRWSYEALSNVQLPMWLLLRREDIIELMEDRPAHSSTAASQITPRAAKQSLPLGEAPSADTGRSNAAPDVGDDMPF